MAERQRGPRDWEPSDPDGQWWNPRPGDAYGPSDQERRQPWERPAPIRRFGGDAMAGLPPAPPEPPLPSVPPPPPPSPKPQPSTSPPPQTPWSELLQGLGLLALAVVLVGAGVAVFIGSWRAVAVTAVAVAITAGIELAILGAASMLGQALRQRRARAAAALRVAVPVFALAALALAPAGLGLVLRDQRWSPGIWLALAGIVVAAGLRTAAALTRRGLAVPAAPPVQRATGLAVFTSVAGVIVFVLGCACLVAPAGIQQAFHDPLADEGVAVPRASLPIPEPTWAPRPGGDPAEVIRHDLESRVLISAGVPGTVESECVRAFEQRAFVCAVTYEGYEVQFGVDTTPVGDGSYDYDAESVDTIITQAGVYAQFFAQHGGYDRLRCDELPAVALVRAGAALSQHCYAKDSAFDETTVFRIVPQQPGEPPSFLFESG